MQAHMQGVRVEQMLAKGRILQIATLQLWAQIRQNSQGLTKCGWLIEGPWELQDYNCGGANGVTLWMRHPHNNEEAKKYARKSEKSQLVDT